VIERLQSDFSRTRWISLSYVVLVLVATALLLAERDRVQSWIATVVCVVSYFVGVVLFARLIQYDLRAETDESTPGNLMGPTPANAMPGNPMSVFRARLVSALLFVTLPTIGQIITLWDLGVPTGEIPLLALESAAMYAAALFFVGVIASRTENMRTLIPALFGLAALSSALSWLRALIYGGELNFFGNDNVSQAELSAIIMAIGIAGLLLWQQYRFGRSWQGIFTALAVFVVLAFLPSSGARAATVDSRSAATLPDSLRSASIGFASDQVQSYSERGTQGWLTLHAQLTTDPAAPGYRHVFRIREMTLEGANGTRRVTPPDTPVLIFEPIPPLNAGQRWIAKEPRQQRFYEVSFQVTRTQREELEKRGASLTIAGDIEVLAPRSFDVPLRDGSVFRMPGARFVVTNAERMLLRESIGIYNVGAGSANERLMTGAGWYRFNVVNDRTGEVVALRNADIASSNRGLMLPLIRETEHVVSLLVVEDSDLQALRERGASRINESHLTVINWTSLGHYPAQVRNHVRMTAGQ
jgi:hypothetical protein